MSASNGHWTIMELWRFPVKSMRGEQLEQISLTENGILGDRAYALIDVQTGKVVSAKSVKLFPDILNCCATFISPVLEGAPLPPVEITLPDGSKVRSDSANVDQKLTEYFGRAVTLAQVAPEDFTIDQYHPDLEGADSADRRNVVVPQKLGAALFAELGMESPVVASSFFDVFPLSVLTTSTLAKLSELEPQTRFDRRRFRMNIILNTEAAGFIENSWVGSALVTTGGTSFNVVLPDPRCVMTTLAQEDLPQDINVLRTLVRHNKIQVGDLGVLPCAGVYASVAVSGMLRINDIVTIRPAEI